MPIHDWTRVNAGIFLGPDVLTLETVQPEPQGSGKRSAPETEEGGIAVAVSPPKVRLTAVSEMTSYARKRSRVVIRHVSGHRVVAMIEIVSPGNKSSQQAMAAFVSKAVEMIEAGIHLLIVEVPKQLPLTLVAYSAGDLKCAYVENVALGQALPEMP